jgi:hypothetical protein
MLSPVGRPCSTRLGSGDLHRVRPCIGGDRYAFELQSDSVGIGFHRKVGNARRSLILQGGRCQSLALARLRFDRARCGFRISSLAARS